jgi:hypothetical protein
MKPTKVLQIFMSQIYVKLQVVLKRLKMTQKTRPTKQYGLKVAKT